MIDLENVKISERIHQTYLLLLNPFVEIILDKYGRDVELSEISDAVFYLKPDGSGEIVNKVRELTFRLNVPKSEFEITK